MHISDLANYLYQILHDEFIFENFFKYHVKAKNFGSKYYLSCIASIGFGLNVDCFGEKKSTFEEKAG